MKDVNLARLFHAYGFHRDKGFYPGEKLAEKLRPLFDEAKRNKETLSIDLSDMRAFYRSFADGAFGIYMDEMREEFFNHFHFKSQPSSHYMETIERVYQHHKHRNFK